jgi:hypothetical protein
MNEQLLKLYSSKWRGLSAAITTILEDDILDIKPANPLLLYIKKEEDYKTADIRLMVFGQETNGWYDEGANMEAVRGNYDNFFNGEKCWGYGGQFWNGVSRFLSSLQSKYPDKRIRAIWNNIVKIGKQSEKGFPPDYIYEIEREFFHVIPDELQILKPNVVLFLTGPNYDSIIADNFGELKHEALTIFPERELSEVSLDGVDFAFRTYHPNYLWRKGIDKYFETIIENIKL